MKIAYCTNGICFLGGISLVTIHKANALAEVEGNEVYVCVSDHFKSDVASRLSNKVTLVDLNIDYSKDDWKSPWHLMVANTFKRWRHKKRLAQALRAINPDIVISTSLSEKYMVADIKGPWKRVREFHLPTDYRKHVSTGFVGRLKARINEIYDLKWKNRAYDRVVVLTNEDKELNWRGEGHVRVIPNPLGEKMEESAPLTNKKIITVGRLEPQKNHGSLIRAFRKVADVHPDWTLEIYGVGSLQNRLQTLINELGLQENVFLKGATLTPQKEILASSVFVLTSVYEGFGVVLTEAMQCGVPVVSYDCPCGPKDIITDGVDGFLVPSGDETALAEKICRLIDDPTLRRQMGASAKQATAKYDIENIRGLWMQLFRELVGDK